MAEEACDELTALVRRGGGAPQRLQIGVDVVEQFFGGVQEVVAAQALIHQ